MPSSNSQLAVEAELMDKAMWGVPSTVCTVVNRESLLGIRFGLLCLRGSPPATDHKLGMQILVVTSAVSLMPVLTRLEIWEVRTRNQRGGASGIGEVSRPAAQGMLEWLGVLFRSGTIPAAPTCLAFSTFRGCLASAEGQEEEFAWVLKVASKIGKSSCGI